MSQTLSQPSSQTEAEIQLQVWKDLALSKQLLANEVIKALDLDTTVSAAQLKDALNKLIDRAKHADDNIKSAREASDVAINEFRTEFKQSEKARLKAEAAIDEAMAGKLAAEKALEAGRETNSGSLKKAKDELAKKDRELKTINSALADTPENVVKKLKTLKKQKLEENIARKAAEAMARTQKKEIKDLNEQLEERKKLLEQSNQLVEHYRELRTAAEALREQVGDDAEALPVQDDKLLEGIEMAATVEVED